MKNIVKSILPILFFYIGITNSKAQIIKAVIEVNSVIKNIKCNIDTVERNFTIEKIEINKNSKIISATYKGCQFEIVQELNVGKYTISLSGLEFETERLDFEINETNKGKIILTGINLKQKTSLLKEVTVYGNRKQFLKIETDKTVVTLKNNSMLNSGSSFDAIKRLPGVILSPSRNLTLNGKDVKIYIDGSPSTLNGKDLENYLSSVPANAIEKIELIHNPGASFDATSNGSVINILSNTKHQKGLYASVNLNYNFNKYQNPSPQILLNGRNNNLSWQTMLGYNYITNEELVSTVQTFTSFNPVKTLLQTNSMVNNYRNVYFRIGTNYKLSNKSSLLFNYNNTFANDRLEFNATTLGDGVNYSENGTTKNQHSNHELSFQYKYKIDSLGRTLDITAFVNTYSKNPIKLSKSLMNETNLSNIDFCLTNAYLKYDFAIPFKDLNFSINTGGKYNVVKVRDYGIYNFSNISNNIDFNYKENSLAFYVEARKKVKKFNFTGGLRFEDFNVERFASNIVENIKFSNSKLFPSASANFEINSNMNLSTTYSKKIKQPNYDMIDPNNSALFNQYNSSAGNILLKPAFYDNYEVKLNAFQFVQIGANYKLSRDDSRFIFNAESGKLISNQSFQSFDQIKTFSTFLSFPIPLDYFFKGKAEFLKRMNNIEKMNYIYVNINYIKSKIEGYEFPFSNKAIYNLSMQSQLILPWNVTNIMAYSIMTKGVYEVYHITKPIQQFDVSFNKEFIDKKLKVGLHVFDLFNMNETNGLIVGQNLETLYHQKHNSRVFRISLTYNFGNLKLHKENTEIQNEKIQKSSGLL
ncbi:MAG: outer membrane beta-barrel family protein [Bacteroidota bacterium]